MDNLARPKKGSRLYQSRAKRGFDFYLNPLDTSLFDHMIRDLGFSELAGRIYYECRSGRKLYGDDPVKLAIEGVLHQLLLRRAIKSPRVNLTSEPRYDAIYHLLTVMGEYYPKYADRIQRKRNRFEQIRSRYDDNYRYRSRDMRGRRTINHR